MKIVHFHLLLSKYKYFNMFVYMFVSYVQCETGYVLHENMYWPCYFAEKKLKWDAPFTGPGKPAVEIKSGYTCLTVIKFTSPFILSQRMFQTTLFGTVQKNSNEIHKNPSSDEWFVNAYVVQNPNTHKCKQDLVSHAQEKWKAEYKLKVTRPTLLKKYLLDYECSLHSIFMKTTNIV